MCTSSLLYSPLRSISLRFDLSLHTECTRKWPPLRSFFRFMACPGSTQRQVCDRNLPSRAEGEAWARAIESKIDRSEPILPHSVPTKIFGGSDRSSQERPSTMGRTKMIPIRDRKDPRRKVGNDQRIPLLSISGYDSCDLIEEHRQLVGGRVDRIFPYNDSAVGTAFRRACRDIDIDDLHCDDLCYEAISRLFEARLSIEQARTLHRPQRLEDVASLYPHPPRKTAYNRGAER